eukprot:UN04634
MDIVKNLYIRYLNNQYSWEIEGSENNNGIYCIRSLINHSCVPNVWTWPKSPGKVFACANIEKGQQLFVIMDTQTNI